MNCEGITKLLQSLQKSNSEWTFDLDKSSKERLAIAREKQSEILAFVELFREETAKVFIPDVFNDENWSSFKQDVAKRGTGYYFNAGGDLQPLYDLVERTFFGDYFEYERLPNVKLNSNFLNLLLRYSDKLSENSNYTDDLKYANKYAPFLLTSVIYWVLLNKNCRENTELSLTNLPPLFKGGSVESFFDKGVLRIDESRYVGYKMSGGEIKVDSCVVAGGEMSGGKIKIKNIGRRKACRKNGY